MDYTKEMIERIEKSGHSIMIMSTTKGAFGEVRDYKNVVLYWSDGDTFLDVIREIDLKIREKNI